MVYLLTCISVVLAAALLAASITIRRKNGEIHKIRKLNDIGKKITSNIKFKNLMKDIMEMAKEEIGAEACSLYQIDEERQELWFEVALGEKGDSVKEIRLKIGEGSIAGLVAKEGVTLNLRDVNKDPRSGSRDIAKKIEFREKAMLTMPVRFKKHNYRRPAVDQ